MLSWDMLLSQKSWSPYLAGVLIGLLQIPTFLLMDTALGASSSYVTVAAHLAAVLDPGVSDIKYFASHMWGPKNWWQVAVIVGIAIGAGASMRLSGARRQAISPVWARTMGARRAHHASGRAYCRRMHLWARRFRV
jgi:hypothetical protein